MIKFLTNQKPGFVLPKTKAQRSKKEMWWDLRGLVYPSVHALFIGAAMEKRILALNRMRQRWSE